MKKIKITFAEFIKTYENTTKDGKSKFTSHHYKIKYIREGETDEQERTGFVTDNQRALLVEGHEIEIIETTKTKDTKVFHNFEIATEAKAEKSKEQDWKANIVAKIKELETRIKQLEEKSIPEAHKAEPEDWDNKPKCKCEKTDNKGICLECGNLVERPTGKGGYEPHINLGTKPNIPESEIDTGLPEEYPKDKNANHEDDLPF